MIDGMADIQARIASSFDCIEYWEAEPELGLKRLPISGQFIRTVDFDGWVSRVKALLPSDAKLILFEGAAMRMAEPNDLWLMFFGSETWEIVPEGEIIPGFQPLFLQEATGDPLFDVQAITIPPGVEFRLFISKRTHVLSIPKDRETDEMCAVVVRPKA